MRLDKLIEGIKTVKVTGDTEVEIGGIFYDSRKVIPGGLFFAIRGFDTDGHKFIDDAVKRGAVAVVVEEDLNIISHENVTAVQVTDSRAVMGAFADKFYGHPSMDLKLIGITGTNGKTTVCYIIEEIIRAAGKSPGIIGTINYRYLRKIVVPPHTTPEAIDLSKLMREMVDSGVTHAAMEVSSHALDLKRVDHCMFDVAVFTNLTQDHLDYHGTMEEYFERKARLFTELININIKGKKETTSVINVDDPWGKKLTAMISGEVVTFSLKPGADIYPTNFELDTAGVRGEMKTPKGVFEFDSNLLGKHNIYNIMSAVGAAMGAGLGLDAVKLGINGKITIPGRLEAVDCGQGFLVLVDYAHTDDALKNVLSTLRPLAKKKLITLFGCGGDRDKRKRPKMARAAAEQSDKVVVTSDNPRTEEPNKIIEGILDGFEGMDIVEVEAKDSAFGGSENVFVVIPDRRRAIAFAVSEAERGDIVLIAGKGHEDYQIIGTKKYPFDDKVEAEKVLVERGRDG